MPESEPEERKPSDSSSSAIRRRGLTPEQRRFLGTPRPTPDKAAAPAQCDTPTYEAPLAASAASDFTSASGARVEAPATAGARKKSADVLAPAKGSRRLEMRSAILILGALLFLIIIFLAGRKFDALKYRIMTRLNAKELEGGPNKFPGLTTDELIETALAAERRGDWQEASERLIAAKRNDRTLPGILFRIGKSSYDRGDLNGATVALDHALRFGENLPVANYYRGLIAVRQHELPAAAGYFEAATRAEPFVADFFYYWGEALRLDQHPREAIKRYQQAVQRTPSTSDATLCRFKIRLARIEAAEASQVAAEVEEARAAGSLSVDWLMTEAALELHAGKIPEARQLISEARAKGVTGLYLTCAGDTVFRKAADVHPQIAEVIDQPTSFATPSP